MVTAVSDETHLELLLSRLARLKLLSQAVDRGDRGQLVALLDEVEKIKRELVRGRERVGSEMARATTRTTAITAYARGAGAPVRRH
ncbi:hypothetical protein KQX63_03370 [Rhodopseudomonas palustris]|uniref:hypothetical protein n=1 Tax=Rhodopseudomonas palustris TaxID=1076 RepID=UPI0021F2610E|nr:hypothetical protein [Rhodopseudomonas palustris]UYO45084.1 hypothetical protein KQX63_03370 [Rhodopseudomonas palustris]UYO49675.1 hypothetical protein KQX64_03410 [Rhodopseudomonas palustris]